MIMVNADNFGLSENVSNAIVSYFKEMKEIMVHPGTDSKGNIIDVTGSTSLVPVLKDLLSGIEPKPYPGKR